MSIFSDIADSVGGFVKDYGKPLAALAIGGGAAYGTYRQQKAREQQMKAYNDAKDQEYQDQLDAYNARGSGGGGGGGGRKRKASALYNEYYKQSLDMLAPYVDSAKRLLPKKEAAYAKGTEGLSELAKIMFTPESFARTNQSVPAYQVPLKIPEFLKGGAK